MQKLLVSVICVVLAGAMPAVGQDRVTLGFGRLFTNDALGDGHDRWRTGGTVVSVLRGAAWTGSLPSAPGEVLEFRLRADIIAPASIVTAAPGDRRYAGTIALGLHTHFALGQAEASVGADVIALGPQTGLGRFQMRAHDLLGLERPEVLGDQIGNQVLPSLTLEVGQTFQFGPRVAVRPFVEAQAGLETLLRAGGDVVIGGAWQGGLMLRDVGTGQRYVGIDGGGGGLSFTLGGDVARMFGSAYLPAGGVAVLSDHRERLRAGVAWQGDRLDAFYGLTYLSPEFEGQDEGQVLGSLRVDFKF
jgi:Uncharacterized protein conserved in bacteria (DUF2219)